MANVPRNVSKPIPSTLVERDNLCEEEIPSDAYWGISYADQLLVDGNPIADIQLNAHADRHFVIVMKDGKICKNTLI